jgi:hypothetical protein
VGGESPPEARRDRNLQWTRKPDYSLLLTGKFIWTELLRSAGSARSELVGLWLWLWLRLQLRFWFWFWLWLQLQFLLHLYLALSLRTVNSML